jgi:hypothetical protein
MDTQDLKLDYFKIYDVKDYRLRYRVTLQGQFDKEAEEAELLFLSYFANPVSKNQEPIYNRNAHLTWYWLYQPIPEPTRKVAVENQFGRQRILIGKPSALLAPAQKRQRGSQFPMDLDHFKLYWVLEGEPVNQGVELQDQFGDEGAKVLYPILFGVPVNKRYKEKVSPIRNKKAHLVIYRITPRPLQQAGAVRDQFSGRRYRELSFLRSVLLAVPSVKLEWKEV